MAKLAKAGAYLLELARRDAIASNLRQRRREIRRRAGELVEAKAEYMRVQAEYTRVQAALAAARAAEHAEHAGPETREEEAEEAEAAAEGGGGVPGAGLLAPDLGALGPAQRTKRRRTNRGGVTVTELDSDAGGGGGGGGGGGELAEDETGARRGTVEGEPPAEGGEAIIGPLPPPPAEQVGHNEAADRGGPTAGRNFMVKHRLSACASTAFPLALSNAVLSL